MSYVSASNLVLTPLHLASSRLTANKIVCVAVCAIMMTIIAIALILKNLIISCRNPEERIILGEIPALPSVKQILKNRPPSPLTKPSSSTGQFYNRAPTSNQLKCLIEQKSREAAEQMIKSHTFDDLSGPVQAAIETGWIYGLKLMKRNFSFQNRDLFFNAVKSNKLASVKFMMQEFGANLTQEDKNLALDIVIETSSDRTTSSERNPKIYKLLIDIGAQQSENHLLELLKILFLRRNHYEAFADPNSNWVKIYSDPQQGQRNYYRDFGEESPRESEEIWKKAFLEYRKTNPNSTVSMFFTSAIVHTDFEIFRFLIDVCNFDLYSFTLDRVLAFSSSASSRRPFIQLLCQKQVVPTRYPNPKNMTVFLSELKTADKNYQAEVLTFLIKNANPKQKSYLNTNCRNLVVKIANNCQRQDLIKCLDTEPIVAVS